MSTCIIFMVINQYWNDQVSQCLNISCGILKTLKVWSSFFEYLNGFSLPEIETELKWHATVFVSSGMIMIPIP